MSNHHTRKTFFAKAITALAGLGILGGSRLTADTASGSPAPRSGAAESGTAPSTSHSFTIQADARAVARSVDSL